MGIAGQFLRDLFGIAGVDRGACCRFQTGGGFSCIETSRGSCFNGADVNPDPQTFFFYPNILCSEVECGTVACCLPDGCDNTPWLGPGGQVNPFDPDCATLGGEPQVRGTQCSTGICEVEQPDERPEGCIKETTQESRARTGRPSPPPGGFTWNTDLCQNAQFRMTIRLPSMPPADSPTRSVTSLNYGEMMSIGAIRANETAPGVEPCRHHFAKLVQGNDGYARMMMCGQHVAGDPDTLQVSEGWLYLEDDSIRPKPVPIDQRIDNGYAAVAAGYRAPYWVEGIFHASQVYCGGVV